MNIFIWVLVVFTIFCFLFDEIDELKVLACSYDLLILKIPSVTLLEDPKAAILTLKMLTGSRL